MRGVRKSDSELLESLDKEIAEMNSRKERIEIKLQELESKRQDILDGKKQRQAEELIEMIQKIGKTPEEILELLKTQNVAL